MLEMAPVLKKQTFRNGLKNLGLNGTLTGLST